VIDATNPPICEQCRLWQAPRASPPTSFGPKQGVFIDVGFAISPQKVRGSLISMCRRPIIYAGFVIMGVAMVTVGTLFNMGIEKHPELGYVAIFALLIFIIFFLIFVPETKGVSLEKIAANLQRSD
jgi:hypothetical protein